jgi:hypothetical protein
MCLHSFNKSWLRCWRRDCLSVLHAGFGSPTHCHQLSPARPAHATPTPRYKSSLLPLPLTLLFPRNNVHKSTVLTYLLTKTQPTRSQPHSQSQPTPPIPSRILPPPPNTHFHSYQTTNHYARRPLPMRLRPHQRHVRRVLLAMRDAKHARPRHRRGLHRRRHYAHVLEPQRSAVGAAGNWRIWTWQQRCVVPTYSTYLAYFVQCC